MITDQQTTANVAANLQRFLKEHPEYSQSEIARITGDSKMAISYYVRGLRHPSSGAVARLAEALNLTADELLKTPKRRGRRKTLATS